MNGVVEEGGVHRLPHHLVAAEREREVRDAAARQRARAALLDQRQRRDEVAGEEIVLLDPGRDREDVGVEDDVLGREAGLPGEEVVGATADRDLSLHRLRLALLVEGHHHHGRPEPPHLARLGEEVVLAFLQRDRVDDPLPLHAPETGLDHRPLRAVDHHRHARDLGLGRDQVQEPRHRGLRIQHPLVHVHVEQVGAAAHLLQRHVDGARVVVGLDQPPEPCRAGHVRPLPHHHEARLRPDRERLQARPPRRLSRVTEPRAWRKAFDCGGDRRDVLGRRSAATADRVDQPALCELPQQRRRLGRLLVVAAERIRQARHSDSTRRARPPRGPTRPARRASRSPPREQLIATASRPACSIEAQNASTVWPDSVRPLRSTTVSETTSGNPGATSWAATIAAFAFSVSNTVSISRRSTPPSTRPRICSAYASRTSSKVAERNEGSSTRAEIDSVTFSGPTDPATNRGLSGVETASHAARARRAPSTFIS